jgi:hypothetical protein
VSVATCEEGGPNNDSAGLASQRDLLAVQRVEGARTGSIADHHEEYRAGTKPR